MIFGDHGSEEPSTSVKVDAWLNPRLVTEAYLLTSAAEGTQWARLFSCGISRGIVPLVSSWILLAVLEQGRELRSAKSYGGAMYVCRERHAVGGVQPDCVTHAHAHALNAAPSPERDERDD